MKLFSVSPLSLTIAAAFAAMLVLFSATPKSAHAAAVTVSALTATSTPAYSNTGFATTTRAKVGDTIQYQLTLSGGAPLVAPQINILGKGSTTMSGATTNWYYATTTTSNSSVWNDGLVSFQISVGQDTLVGTATTTVTALTTGSNITFDKTSPTLNTVSWTDVDGSTQFSATDTLTLTFSETMATSTIVSGNVDTTLALSGSHTFGTSPTVAWNTAGTVLTITLGTSPTVATADTVDPTTAVKDAIGNNDATVSALAISDTVPPGNPTGLADTESHGSQVTLTATGSSQIRYTTDGSTPTCSVGTVYSGELSITETITLKAIACDEANNTSSVVSAVYTHIGNGGGGSSGGSHSRAKPATPAIPAVTHATGCVPGSGDLFDTTSGKSCTVSATPASPASPAWSNASPSARFNRDLQ
ncbi:MAG: hypothetical protein JWN18_663, partial [Parcubacteria group bacterium]|nr:hypothetical protein [Parcubacteria group bacterium]